MDEKRKYERLPQEVKVKFEKITFPLSAVSSKTDTKSSNISLGGVAISSSISLESGTPVNLEITIPDYYKYKVSYKYTDPVNEASIYAIGTVRYRARKGSGGYETGIEFTSIDPDDLAGIRRYIKEWKEKKND